MTERPGFSGTTVALAALGGAVAGAAVALLTAPRSGRETRERMNTFVKDGREKARHLPPAVKAASVAARNAFTEAMHDEVTV
jgi:gas vesicle protein